MVGGLVPRFYTCDRGQSSMHLVAVIIARMGPYHAARMAGAAAVLGRDGCVAVEVAGRTREYAWDAVGTASFHRRTLFPDSEYESVPDRARAGAVVAALEELQPSAVAINGWSAREARAALRWCRRRRRVAILMSESQRADAARSWHVEVVKRAIVREFDAALVGGRTHADYLAALGMGPERVALGYDVVDNAHFASGASLARAEPRRWRDRLSLPERFFLASARFVEKKNLLFLVDAFARFVQGANSAGVHLVLLGDGPERARIEARVAAAGLCDRVHLPGFKQYEELPFYYGLAEAFVLPSLVEPWGLVVNEAMASGLPVLVSRVCGAAEMVRESVNGCLFEPTDPAQLAELMAWISDGTRNLREMGEVSRAVVGRRGPPGFGEGLARAAELGERRATSRRRWGVHPTLWF